jgi:cytochrome P450
MDVAQCPVAHDFDLYSKEYLADPYKFFNRLREETPVAYQPDLGVYLVTRYDDIVRIFKDRDTFASANSTSPFLPLCDEAKAILSSGCPRLPTLSAADPPRHNDMRGAVAKCLTPKRWAASQPAVRAYATDLVRKIADKPVADLVPDFAYPLPAFAGFALLGFPPEDTDQLKAWCQDRVFLTYGRLEPEAQVAAAKQTALFWSYIEKHVTWRLDEPGDDLTTDLIELQKQWGEDRLTYVDIVNIVYSISLAAHETSQNAMLNGIRRLLENRSLWDQLVAEPAKIPAAVEELLRFDSVTINLRRTVTRDTEIAGVPIPKGAVVMMLTGSAHHDPRRFENPETIDFDRPNAKDHLAFGKQWHFCLGAPLARFEYALALELFTTLTPRMRLVADQHIDYLPIITVRGMDKLLVEPNPAAQGTAP